MKFYGTCIKAFVMGNLGDDLFIHTLCKRYPKEKFILCGEKRYKEQFASLYNLRYIGTDSFFYKWTGRIRKFPAWILNYVLKLAGSKKYAALPGCFEWFSKYSKHNILISGSIFMQLQEGINFQIPYYMGEIEYYQRHPYIIGCNFGPYINEEYRDFYEKRFQDASQVTFRDRYSDSLFSAECTNWAPDILFTYDISYEKKPSIENYVAISVINLNKDGIYDEKKSGCYEKAMTDLVCHLLNQGKKVVLLGLCKDQGDADVISRIQQKLPQNNSVISCCYPDTSAEEIVGYIAHADLVVASRFHAMVLGWVFGKIAVPVVYSEKMTNTIQCVNPDTPIITTEEIGEGTKDLIAVYQECIALGVKPDIDVIRAKAQKHFEKLDKLYGRLDYI